MSHEMPSLVFVSAAPDCEDPLRIKVPGHGPVVLSFASADVAKHFLHCKGLDASLMAESQLPSAILDEELLVFESAQAVDEAYRNQTAYVFSKLLRPWPRSPHAT